MGHPIAAHRVLIPHQSARHSTTIPRSPILHFCTRITATMKQRIALRIAVAACLLLACHCDDTDTTTTTNAMFPGAIAGVDGGLINEIAELVQTADSINVPIPESVLQPQLLFSLPLPQGTYVQGTITANVFEINQTAFSNAHGNIKAVTAE